MVRFYIDVHQCASERRGRKKFDMPPSYWVRLDFAQAVYGIPLNTSWDYRTEVEPTTADLIAFLVTWTNDVMSLINAIQPTTISNVHVRAVWRGNTAVQAESAVAGTGDVVVATDDQQVSSASLAFKKFVGPSIGFDGVPYTEPSRQINHGYVFIPGASDAWISGGRSVIPTALVSALDDVEDVLADSIVGGSNNFIPIVHGFALAAQASPTVLPARPEVFADIEGSTFKWVTWHESREVNTQR